MKTALDQVRELLEAHHESYPCPDGPCGVCLALMYISRDGGWQPIETAPRDGTSILLLQSGCRYVAHWSVYVEQWVVDKGAAQGNYPTHWQPLPDPPEVAEQLPDARGAEGEDR